jgi:uncharacterized protein YlaN (UPF0358 family)
MDDVLKQALADAETAAPTQAKLVSVEQLIAEQLRLEDLLERLEEKRKETQALYDGIRDRQLPDALLEAGVSEFKTTAGMKVKIEKLYLASVTKPNAPVFYDWLDDQGHGGIIESNITIPFGKGDRALAKTMVEAIRKEFHSVPEPQLTDSIHWATLRAFAREQIEEGNDLPPELSVHQVDRAKITRPKEK